MYDESCTSNECCKDDFIYLDLGVDVLFECIYEYPGPS